MSPRVPDHYLDVQVPTGQTLKRYGLDLAGWKRIVFDQKGVCSVCEKLPKSGRLCIDHEHVRGWKKMPPHERVKYVRGLLCHFCNHYYLARNMTVDKAENVRQYLERYNARTVTRKDQT